MRLPRNLLSAVTLVLAAVSAMAAPPVRAESWEAYRPDGAHQSVGAGFRVYMPADYDQLEKDPGGSIGVEAERGGLTFTTTHRPHPVRPDAVDADFDALRDAALRQVPGAKLGREGRRTLAGMPMRDLELVDAGGAVVGVRRFVLFNGWLIALAVDGPPGVDGKPETGWFLGSLTLVGALTGKEEPPLRSYVVCFNGRPCGGVPCPSTSALDVEAGQEIQGIYFDLGGATADVRAQASDDEMFRGGLVVSGRMGPGKVAESREYPLLRVVGIVRKAEGNDRRHCAVRQ